MLRLRHIRSRFPSIRGAVLEKRHGIAAPAGVLIGRFEGAWAQGVRWWVVPCRALANIGGGTERERERETHAISPHEGGTIVG